MIKSNKHVPGWESLAHEIVKRAADDYRAALKAGAPAPSCERFFASGWCEMLAGMPGEIIAEKIRKEVSRG